MKLRYLILILLVASVGWFQFTQIEPKRNRNNASQVRLGMTSEEVLQLIGSPDKKSIVFTTGPDVDYTYSYRAPFASSDRIYISFDKQDQVIHIVNE